MNILQLNSYIFPHYLCYLLHDMKERNKPASNHPPKLSEIDVSKINITCLFTIILSIIVLDEGFTLT